MIRLSLPGAAMAVFEWLSFEIMTFSTSYLGTIPLAAQSIFATTAVVMWHISFSASIAAGTRVEQLIGSGAVNSAKQASMLYFAMFIFIACFNSSLTLICKSILPRTFTTDDKVRTVVTATIPIVAAFEFFDATAAGLQGVIRGLGWQSIGAWVTLLVNYSYAVPLALILELGLCGAPYLGLHGLWGSLASGLAILHLL